MKIIKPEIANLEICEYSSQFLSKIYEINKIAAENSCHVVDLDYIKKGLVFAKYYHRAQFRKSGEPYVSHPINVASMVAENVFRENPIISALLHDTVEDTSLTLSEIEQEFDPRISELVSRLTRFVDFVTGKKITAEEKIRLSKKYNDREMVLIKLCDRIDNIKTLHLLDKKKANRILKESIIMFCYWGLEFDLLDLSIKGYLICREMQAKINNKEVGDNYIPDFRRVFSEILSSNF